MQVAGFGEAGGGRGGVPAGQAHLLAFVYASIICKRFSFEIELLEGLQRGGAPGEPPSAAVAAPPGVKPVSVVRRTEDSRQVVLVQSGDPNEAEELARSRGKLLAPPSFSIFASAAPDVAGPVPCLKWPQVAPSPRPRCHRPSCRPGPVYTGSLFREACP